jgi:hypothetical protein
MLLRSRYPQILGALLVEYIRWVGGSSKIHKAQYITEQPIVSDTLFFIAPPSPGPLIIEDYIDLDGQNYNLSGRPVQQINDIHTQSQQPRAVRQLKGIQNVSCFPPII